MAARLLKLHWRRKNDCYPQKEAASKDLRAIRLHPPRSRGYFLELLGLPTAGQRKDQVWNPMRLPDGWYGVPTFRFMRVVVKGRLPSREGLEYAPPSMMALANLLAHTKVGTKRMNEPILNRSILRSAKDLGRVLALAWLEGRDGTTGWGPLWRRALRGAFPKEWPVLTRHLGSGLQELMGRPEVLEEARYTTNIGLLSGRGVTADHLRAVAARLWVDVIEPVRSTR